MRAIGLDLGSRTIGTAVTDELGITAQPHLTLQRVGPRKDLERLRSLADELGATRFVLGLPLTMKGDEGTQARAAREFGDALRAHTGLEVDYVDERLTTVTASRVLREGDVSRATRKRVVDTVAAVIILQSWLESRRVLGGGAPSE